MNTKEAITHLAKRGIRVDQVGKNQFRVWDEGGKVWDAVYRRKNTRLRSDIYKDDVWCGREVVALASDYSSENKQSTAIKKNTKKFNNKNRAHERDKIKTENFDAIPQNELVREENIWNWD